MEHALELDPFEATEAFQAIYNHARTVLGDGNSNGSSEGSGGAGGAGGVNGEHIEAATRALQDVVERVDRLKIKIGANDLKEAKRLVARLVKKVRE